MWLVKEYKLCPNAHIRIPFFSIASVSAMAPVSAMKELTIYQERLLLGYFRCFLEYFLVFKQKIASFLTHAKYPMQDLFQENLSFCKISEEDAFRQKCFGQELKVELTKKNVCGFLPI